MCVGNRRDERIRGSVLNGADLKGDCAGGHRPPAVAWRCPPREMASIPLLWETTTTKHSLGDAHTGWPERDGRDREKAALP